MGMLFPCILLAFQQCSASEMTYIVSSGALNSTHYYYYFSTMRTAFLPHNDPCPTWPPQMPCPPHFCNTILQYYRFSHNLQKHITRVGISMNLVCSLCFFCRL